MNLHEYIAELDRLYRTGRATEHTYRPALQALLDTALPALAAINEPARTDCGAPDFILVRRRDNLPVAFVEAKDIDDPDLDGRRQHREQFDRYRHSLAHIAFTDYLDFHLYEDGEPVAQVRVADVSDGRIRPRPKAEEAFNALLSRLTSGGPQRITSASRLAAVMAAKARLLADTVGRALAQRADSYDDESLHGLFRAFRNVLIHDAEPEEFADLYAQTITYGLFAARLHDDTPDTFSRQEAASLIPKTNPFLRRFFQSIAGYDLDDRIAWLVDDLAATFRAVDLRRLLADYGRDGRRDDPMIHFYEDFLTAYDPAQRKAKGVWYTPQPVVRFIVRAVDQLLRRDFGLTEGLADASRVSHKVVEAQAVDRRTADHRKRVDRSFHRVQILDPATGTGTFLAEAVRLVRNRFEGREGLWQDYVERDLLPRLGGFELLMASYAIAHLKLDLLLEQTGYRHRSDRRLHVYLTNSLESPADERTLFDQLFSEEAEAANRVKRDAPVMVMMGNPPYNGASRNKGEWIMNLMRTYKMEPGGQTPLKERNPKWLNDDYVKFIRLAHYYIERTGTGIVAFINPHGYLDNPTFRGMRWQLLRTFDRIYTIDLHGNSKKHETAPDGSKDENVFDIQQGVSINLFIRTQEKHDRDHMADVYHYDLYGLRSDKYNFLDSHSLADIPFQRLAPQPPMYFFVPKDFTVEAEYKKGFGVNELFNICILGPNSHRDHFAIAFTQEEATQRINDLLNTDKTNEELRKEYQLKDNRDWKLNEARQGLKGNEKAVECLYRPFDRRYMLYGSFAFDYLRPQLNDHLLQPNYALLYTKQTKELFSCFVTDRPLGQHKIVTPYDGSYASPLFLYKEDDTSPVPNFRPEVVAQIERGLGEKVEPLELFDYVYAVLYSPRYRERYREMLRIDFPRVPYPADAAAYHQLADIGARLRRTHLMEDAEGWPPGMTYPVGGSNEVTDPHWADGRAYVNDTQYVGGVAEAVWNAAIGGYQPAQKWLKDRRGRRLTHDDIAHYARTLRALSETLRLMREVNTILTLPA